MDLDTLAPTVYGVLLRAVQSFLPSHDAHRSDLKAGNVMLAEAAPPPPGASSDGRSSAAGSAAASTVSTAASGGAPAGASAPEGAATPHTPAAVSIAQQLLLGSTTASVTPTPRSSSRQAPTGNAWPTYTAKVADFSHSMQVELALRRLQQQAGGGAGGGGGGMEGEMASPSHAAPELFEEGAKPTFASDIYSLGALFSARVGCCGLEDSLLVGSLAC